MVKWVRIQWVCRLNQVLVLDRVMFVGMDNFQGLGLEQWGVKSMEKVGLWGIELEVETSEDRRIVLGSQVIGVVAVVWVETGIRQGLLLWIGEGGEG